MGLNSTDSRKQSPGRNVGVRKEARKHTMSPDTSSQREKRIKVKKTDTASPAKSMKTTKEVERVALASVTNSPVKGGNNKEIPVTDRRSLRRTESRRTRNPEECKQQ